jgi:glutamine amidotransferase
MIVIVDYGMGNLRSVEKAFEHLGVQAGVSSDPQTVSRADKLVVPGVGAFPKAMEELRARRLVEPIQRHLRAEKPYLGICLGLQLLFESSDEGTGGAGFGVLPGRVVRFTNHAVKVPHMGWNAIRLPPGRPACPLLHDVPDGSYVYFVHSYYGTPQDRAVIAAETDYGTTFASMVWRNRLFATQFHPEKSQAVGLRMLHNFAAL